MEGEVAVGEFCAGDVGVVGKVGEGGGVEGEGVGDGGVVVSGVFGGFISAT